MHLDNSSTKSDIETFLKWRPASPKEIEGNNNSALVRRVYRTAEEMGIPVRITAGDPGVSWVLWLTGKEND